jgi:large subunit ribosomal protein L9
MSIEVILREHVEHLGERGEIVRVANGYARNYLLPRKLALPVTAESRRQIERERSKAEARDAEEVMVAQALADRIKSLELVIERRVGENDILFGSVTSADLAEELASREIAVDKRKILMTEALKTAGEHTVTIKLHREVSADLTITITAQGATESEES